MTAEIIDLAALKAARAHRACQESQRSAGLQVLFGAQAEGHNCPHCGEELAEALAMPHALDGYGCRNCQVWYSK